MAAPFKFNPEAKPFVPRKQQLLVANPDAVPDHLVGRTYRGLTQDERWEVKKWRRGNKRCENCGFTGHDTYSCHRGHNDYTRRLMEGRCLECNSKGHVTNCPIIKKLKEELGRLAMPGEVPRHLEGAAYAYLTPKARQEAIDYRLKHQLCIECAGKLPDCHCTKRA